MNMRVDTTGSMPGGWSGQDADATTVNSGESTLAQVASRLGVSLEDLQNANPQITNPSGLTPGLELRMPPAAKGEMPASRATEGAPADATSAALKRMDSNMDGLAMRAVLGSVSAFTSAADSGGSGGGGIAQEPPVLESSGHELYHPPVIL